MVSDLFDVNLILRESMYSHVHVYCDVKLLWHSVSCGDVFSHDFAEGCLNSGQRREDEFTVEQLSTVYASALPF